MQALVSGLVSEFTPEKVSAITDVFLKKQLTRLQRIFTSNKSLAIGGGVAASGSNATETLVAINMLNYLAGNIW